ncbi:aldehyde ferredoxin oxidoreductase family protein [Varunaivibrio sulfuroxidans]|uniref:Phenylacetaldehyde:ferredoxin oxidoreductase n=1 Tax=Varunaivibrio sulfuroxidans TaxID=1773489 RepID=A0A4R3JCT8_9PROT|nr:aldehyde ferredoxin oxidoreductase family protein [Varunaivibrio sulfuroxidans]TCS63484.1 phenylacetaldehyde:ferredoxin oxidoreductase [Varunaivibrio sulfuroxidans]WES30371.1 aldehyde ferredoxin oxidoreductase family protein [Varunaivibrio sulfuroxidans]
MAWARKILRVNLTKGTCESEPLNMEWAQKYLGQRGLGTKYLVEETDPKVDPLAPENKMIMATGPLTGTAASTAGRYSVITKGALTGAIACSNAGGFFGNELKNAGFDMIIFEGKSPKPVYLLLEDDNARLLDAAAFWGKSVWDTEEGIKAKHQDPQLRVASIGVAGETGCKYAAIVNDMHRAAGRSGVGAVMGSKNLKAVAVRGTQGVKIDNVEAFMAAVNAGKAVLAGNAVTGEGLPAYGTQVLMNVINETGALPTRNHRDVQFEGAAKISAEAMVEPRRSDGKPNLVRNAACFGCTIACGRISTIDRTHYTVADRPQYHGASGGLEYEAAWALGAATGVSDLDALTFANFICNEQGMDPISLGATIGAAMELFDMGVITSKETGGVALTFGNTQAFTTIVELTARGEGFGADIALGSKRMCEKYGHGELSMSVKGQEFPAYDSRGIQGMGLTYATSNRGACHLRSYTVASEILGVPEKTDPLSSDGKAGLVMAFQDATAVVDSVGLCVFTTFAWSLDDIAPQIDAACEGDWSVENLLKAGERIWTLERQYNLAAGFTGKDDTLPKRLLKDAAKTGPAKGKVNRLDVMLPEYYQLRGWTPNGVPTNETLSRIQL